MSGVEWFSQKGNDCIDNRDYGAYIKIKEMHLLVISDASQKGKNGANLSMILCQHVINNAKSIDCITPEKIIHSLNELHKEIKYRFVVETACYAIACIDNKGYGWAASCGDCRIGFINNNNIKVWLNPVHTLANATTHGFTTENAKSNDRHKVTKCWKSNRFMMPDITPLNISSSILCLATDGHWIEHEILNTPLNKLSDDSSILTLNLKACGSTIKSNNFLLA